MQLGGPEFETILDRLLEDVSQLALPIMPRGVVWMILTRRLCDPPVKKAHLRSTT